MRKEEAGEERGWNGGAGKGSGREEKGGKRVTGKERETGKEIEDRKLPLKRKGMFQFKNCRQAVTVTLVT